MKVKAIDIVNDDRFVRARPDQLPKVEFRLRDGTVIKPRVKDGKVVGFRGTDRSGRPVSLTEIRIKSKVQGTNREVEICLRCRCQSNGKCKCIPITCPIEA